MRRLITATLLSLMVCGSCLSREPAGVEGRTVQTTLFIRAALTGTTVAMVVVEVTAPDIPTPLVFNIPTVNGVAAGAISVPSGSNRTITLHAYEAGGVETHTGSVTVRIQPGTNPAISIVLTPLTGDVPITVTLGSFSVTVGPATATLQRGDTVRLTATVLDANSNPVTGQVAWATLAPTVATVVSTAAQTGRVTGVGPGQTTVFAIYGGVAGPATITVASPPSIFPLHVEPGKRYLVDAQGKPFLLQGDAPWALIAGLTNEDAEQYLEDRRQKGFNTVLVRLLEHDFVINPPNNAYGVGPFLTPGDFSTPNEAYFAHAEDVINLAAQKGILVLLAPAYMGFEGGSQGWYQEMATNGPTKLSTYGTYLANRFRGHDNILWVEGGDFDPPDLDVLRAVPNAIRAVEPKWLHTFHGGRETSALGFLGASEPWLQVNDIYTSNDDVVTKAFQEYQRSHMPFFLIEAHYEGEGADESTVRQQAYQAVLSGGSGQIMGNSPIWFFGTGWQQALDSRGAHTLTYLSALLAGRAWWTLVPDINHTVLTTGVNAGSDQAATARATDGSFVLAYIPFSRPVTVDLGRLNGPNVVARWYDPANGTFASVAGSPFVASGLHDFPSAGVNSSGFRDWVLVLESSP